MRVMQTFDLGLTLLVLKPRELELALKLKILSSVVGHLPSQYAFQIYIRTSLYPVSEQDSANWNITINEHRTPKNDQVIIWFNSDSFFG